MKNSDAFLSVFSELEKWLRASIGAEKATSFGSLVESCAKSNAGVRRYKYDLKEYADLRNAIVHERGDGHVIAEPNDMALADFMRIRAVLLEPPKVVPLFQRKVIYRTVDESIGQAVADMRNGSFSQLPILRDGAVIALLTSETVVRWLASELTNELVSLSETPIHKVLLHVENVEHYCKISKNASLHEVVAKFEEFTSRGKDLDAILITESGDEYQKLIGIITVYDLPLILEKLGLHRISTIY